VWVVGYRYLINNYLLLISIFIEFAAKLLLRTKLAALPPYSKKYIVYNVISRQID
jgi:hypothetical protein